MMKKVIVTGAKGGTGRSIVHVLRQHGYDVVGVDLHPYQTGDCDYVQLDVASDRGLNDVLAGAMAVVHFGSLPTDGWKSRSETFRNLILGGFNVFQACANLGIKRLIHASSIMVYGDFQRHSYLPVDEASPQRPDGIYASSKVMLESLAADMCRWHELSIAALRLGRIVYEGSVAERLLPYTKKGKAAADVLWTYLDARDVAEACRLWIESPLQGFHPFNLAAEDVCIDVPTGKLIAECFPAVAGMRTVLGTHQSPFSCDAIRSALGWESQHNWRELCAAVV